MLALRAVNRAAPTQSGLFHDGLAATAVLAGASIGIQLQLEPAGFAVGIYEVAKCGAAAFYGISQNDPDFFCQSLVALSADAA